MKCTKALCDEKVTHKVHGYAEQEQDGNFVYQLYCATHIAKVEHLVQEF